MDAACSVLICLSQGSNMSAASHNPDLLPASILSWPGRQGHGIQLLHSGSGLQVCQAALSSSVQRAFSLSPHYRAQGTAGCLASQEVAIPAFLYLFLSGTDLQTARQHSAEAGRYGDPVPGGFQDVHHHQFAQPSLQP